MGFDRLIREIEASGKRTYAGKPQKPRVGRLSHGLHNKSGKSNDLTVAIGVTVPIIPGLTSSVRGSSTPNVRFCLPFRPMRREGPPMRSRNFQISIGCMIMIMPIIFPCVVDAQIPGLPGGAAGAGTGASSLGGVGAATATTAAPALATAQPTLLGFLGFSKPHLAATKAKFCASPAGGMLNNALAPYSTLSGGLIPQCCPTVPTDAAIAALAAQAGPNGAQTVAAQVKQDEAEAKARRAAVRYLATVDCHYWPAAEVAIISALRDDRNECVRYEAALALLNGCCCNARTIEALNIVVSGSEKDGKPSETSERVRCAALAALQGCLLRYQPPEPAPPESPQPPEAPKAVGALDPSFRRVAYYYVTLAARPPTVVVADARRTVTRANAAVAARPIGAKENRAAPGQRSIAQAVVRANAPRTANPNPNPNPKAETPAQAPESRRGLFGIIRSSVETKPQAEVGP